MQPLPPLDIEVASLLMSIGQGELGARIRAHRKALDLRQADLAEPSGITSAYVSRIESGDRRPSPLVFAGFASCMNMTPRELIGIDDRVAPGEDLGETLRRCLRTLARLPVASPERRSLEIDLINYSAKAIIRLLS